MQNPLKRENDEKEPRIGQQEPQILLPPDRGAAYPLRADAVKGGFGAQPQPFHRRAALRRDVPRGQGRPHEARYLVRLNEYIAQISRVGNNYNQVVKAINTYLSRNMLPRQIDTLVACTRELKALSEQVSELTKQLREEWLKE